MKEINLVSIADGPSGWEQGLQYVRELPDKSGMLFSYQSPRVLSFWMKNTYLPLDIAFIDKDKRIVKIQGMVPLSLRSVSSGSPCLMALEVPMGMFKSMGIDVGHKVQIDIDNKKLTVHEEE